jgi:predicted Zn-dependent protease
VPFEPANTWEATYYDGRSSRGEPVRVALGDSGLTILRIEGPKLNWSYRELRGEHGSVEGAPVRLERTGAVTEMLLFPDAKALQAIKKLDPSARFGKASSDAAVIVKAFAIPVAVTLVALLAGYKYGLPALGAFMARRVPVEWEEKLGESVQRQMTMLDRMCTDDAVVDPVRRITEKLAAQRQGNPYKFRVAVSEGPLVNAFAAPGGYVVVYRGLLEKTKTPDQLAAVLAHEVSHVLDRHSTTAMMRSISLWALISLLVGDVSGTIISVAGSLEQLRFSREQEDNADRGAMELMARARIDPRGAIGMFETLQKEGGDLPGLAKYFSSHPTTSERIENFRRWSAEVKYRAEPLLPGQPWPPRSAACGGSR